MLETAAWIGLLLFYPSWSLRKRLGLIALGAVGIFGANLVRVVAIIAILHAFGKQSIVIAHTFIGRLLFFGLVMLGMYWYVFSRLTIHSLADRITARMRA
jgi:exosortase family protein XrtG